MEKLNNTNFYLLSTDTALWQGDLKILSCFQQFSSYRTFLKTGEKFSNLSLVENFGNVDILTQENMIDRMLRGLIKQPVEKLDANFVKDVS